MLDEKEFERLQKLACIKLNPKDKKKLWNQLVNIIEFLDQLKNIEINQIEIEQLKLDNSLRIISWVTQYNNIDWLLVNVKHNKIHNNIVIKSVLN
jgi:aspartyl/glutamyl-tRNA(Asn/Gln) amidotransferase C subunit